MNPQAIPRWRLLATELEAGPATRSWNPSASWRCFAPAGRRRPHQPILRRGRPAPAGYLFALILASAYCLLTIALVYRRLHYRFQRQAMLVVDVLLLTMLIHQLGGVKHAALPALLRHGHHRRDVVRHARRGGRRGAGYAAVRAVGQLHGAAARTGLLRAAVRSCCRRCCCSSSRPSSALTWPKRGIPNAAMPKINAASSSSFASRSTWRGSCNR
ncbi:MAG: hypothetical protein M5U09_19125 [Gammaproteobacteria bacterium]|nr:hypothetical protein [Gammaproteobacteria bacterium]